MGEWVLNRLPLRSEGVWIKYGGLQVIILAEFPRSEERWVRFNFIEEIYNVSKRIQAWRTPSEQDINNYIENIENKIG